MDLQVVSRKLAMPLDILTVEKGSSPSPASLPLRGFLMGGAGEESNERMQLEEEEEK